MATLNRILVIEDDRDSAEALVVFLKMWGYDAAMAHGAMDGISAAVATTPDAILCDIGLADVDGFQIARTIRTIRSLDGCHLIAVSGYADQAAKDCARSAGFEDYVVKPFAPDFIAEVLAGMHLPGRERRMPRALERGT
jgi:DNA-binding response OmpR family regulator